MEFDASFLQKILTAKVLNERDGQVICAKFVSFKHNAQDSTVFRSITQVCPHYSNDPTKKEFKDPKPGITDLNYIFSLKDIDNFYAYGKDKRNALFVINFNREKPFYHSSDTENKYWMAGNVVLLQGKDAPLKFYEGNDLVPLTNNVDFFNEKVIGSTETGDLWFRKDKCKKLEAKGNNYKLVDYDCKDPEQLLLSLNALKESGANLNKDEASADDFAILYYEQAPTTTTSTTLATTTEMVTDPDDVFTTSSAQLETPTTTGNVSTDTNDTGLSLLATGLICIIGGLLAIVVGGICIYFIYKYVSKNNETKSKKKRKKSKKKAKKSNKSKRKEKDESDNSSAAEASNMSQSKDPESHNDKEKACTNNHGSDGEGVPSVDVLIKKPKSDKDKKSKKADDKLCGCLKRRLPRNKNAASQRDNTPTSLMSKKEDEETAKGFEKQKDDEGMQEDNTQSGSSKGQNSSKKKK
ncbi:unnamed protein product [Bursaphelenchus okinawaensis]|uniref:Uncharacterized protein n=1 Tax=Bursaphelenchus okinawaensis TaxID=465554 RepID=A0A811K1H4_9BILA|nr:unnamed protein product [Bursaphelenchus okinawaensis]CAG9089044.1 unnamed protein product [Bursaphelenchus okinawaensis]